MKIVRSMRLFPASAFLVFAALSQQAHAAETDATRDFTPAPYLQGAIGQGSLTSPARTGTAMDLSGSARGLGLRAAAGARFGPYLGAEVSFFHLPDKNVDTSVGNAAYSANVLALSATGNLSIRSALLVGRIGYGRAASKVDVPATAYRSSSHTGTLVWGAGLRYPVTPSVDATFDYDNLGAVGKFAQGDKVRASALSLGVLIRF